VSEFVDLSLRAPLAASVNKYHAWMQGELLADQARPTPPSPLYHYTGEATLRGILEHQKLRCFVDNQ
jgi:hypothetical protein